MAAVKSMRWGALRSLATAFRTATRPGTPGVGTRLTSLPRLVWATFRGEYSGTSRGRLFAILGALLYVISPVDLVPELFLPFIGLGDDALVISWIAVSLINETESFLHWERDRDLTVHGDVIRGDVIH
ncbi:MAG TPA: YkvA family protein [Dermatophilaceae bacterium]|jgi:uncharacterized membrane protein YkvA (DUF1232 family)|nr:YkvA family protein [Dermatophilaceae bacterium]